MMEKEQLNYLRKGVMTERKKQVRVLLKICIDEYLETELESIYGAENKDLISKYIERKYKESISEYLMCMEQEDLDRMIIPQMVMDIADQERWEAKSKKGDKRELLQNMIADTYRLELLKLSRDLTEKINDLSEQADQTSSKLDDVEKEIFGNDISKYVSEKDLKDLRGGEKLISETKKTISNVDNLFNMEKRKRKPMLVIG